MKCTTKELSLEKIVVPSRIRKDTGGLEELAADIRKRGLINPITVMDRGDGRYQLIAGLRRVEAIRMLGYSDIRASILSPMAVDELLAMEYSENVQRKDFTIAERLEYADKIKAVEKAKARERMGKYAREGHTEGRQGTDKCPYPEKGESRKAIAQKAGFSSYKLFERAETVAVRRPDLLPKIDTGEATISGAYKQVMGERADQSASFPMLPPDASTPRKPQSVDQIVRAGHDRLMRNPLYAKLYADKQEAVQDANRARAELERKAAFFANQVKHFTSNIDALKRQCEELRAENTALRALISCSDNTDDIPITQEGAYTDA